MTRANELIEAVLAGNDPVTVINEGLKVGTRVQVVNPVGTEDKKYRGKVGVLKRIAQPHGYAVVEIGGKEIHLHPESLEQLK